MANANPTTIARSAISRGLVDPAVAAFKTYEAALAACEADAAANPGSDEPETLGAVVFAAYDALMTTPANSAAGVAAKLRASILRFGDHSEINLEALTVPLADLERFVG
jgi:hypothetical protein